MEVKVLVVGIIDETWFKGTKEERAVKILNCLDRVSSAGQKLKNTFDYTPAPEELEKFSVAFLDGQPITIGVSDWTISNGRLKARGRIVADSVPVEAVKGSVAAAMRNPSAPLERDNGAAVLNGTSASQPVKAGK